MPMFKYSSARSVFVNILLIVLNVFVFCVRHLFCHGGQTLTLLSLSASFWPQTILIYINKIVHIYPKKVLTLALSVRPL